MPLLQFEKKRYIFLGYQRNGFLDFLKFKSILLSLAKSFILEKDVIIDVLKNGPLTEWELSALCIMIKRMQGTQQQLKILADESTILKIESINQPWTTNVSLYSNMHSFVEKTVNQK